ncbi:MAG: hypothetical protein M1819_004438 [Sarea resinae]|nr:MAG: hypothetical protein M1819_004438 [Sarea resinae]
MVNPGSAFITFRRPGVSAQEAAKINELFVDKRKLKVELVSTIPKEHVKPLGERIVSKSNASAPKSAAAAKPATTNNTATRGGRGARGRGRGRRGRDSTARAKPKTAEELDAEMADYFETGVTGAEGAPAATNGAAQPAVTNGGDTGMDDEILVGHHLENRRVRRMLIGP